MTDRWKVVRLRVPVALEDEVASVLGDGSLGVEVEPEGPGTSVVRVYVGGSDDADVWTQRATRVLAAHGLSESGAGLTVAPVADLRWAERWQATLAPIPLGERFVVVPGDGAGADLGRRIVRIRPGMAFGTGEHETTKLCAAVLERVVRAGSRWIDLGTGTGILAIVAARCGAVHVLALDNDPEAVAVARETVRDNEADDLVEVRCGEIGGVDDPVDGVVANIQSSFFLQGAASLARVLARGGHLVASGFLVEDVPEMEAALVGAGFALEATARMGAWAALRLLRT